MKIKLDPADIMFSKFIRERDNWTCIKCKKEDPDGPIKKTSHLQASHFFGRGMESTRFDPENVDTLCFGCHQYWGSTNKEEYRDFKIKQIGQDRFDALKIRANLTVKKDRTMAFIVAKARYDDLVKNG